MYSPQGQEIKLPLMFKLFLQHTRSTLIDINVKLLAFADVFHYSGHFCDSRVTHGANNVRLFHPFHNRRYVLLLKLQVPLVLFNNRHFCGTKKNNTQL